MDDDFVGGSLKLKQTKKSKKKVLDIPQIQSTETPSQLKFKEVQRKRAVLKAEKEALKTHKERVLEFNSYLEHLTEHNDIPKVGPG